MQTFKPIPIPSYTPKFDLHFSAASRKHQDPDAERNEARKVKALYKKERKGAIRELRKDNKFLAVERAKEQKAKDEAYEKKMRQVHGSIATTERAEEKAMERSVKQHCHSPANSDRLLLF
jgi:nucleolar protein 14